MLLGGEFRTPAWTTEVTCPRGAAGEMPVGGDPRAALSCGKRRSHGGGGHRERRTGSPRGSAWPSGAPLCPSPRCPARRGRLKSIQSRAEGTVMPGSALGPGSRQRGGSRGSLLCTRSCVGEPHSAPEGRGPAPGGPHSRLRAKETTPVSGLAPSSLDSVSPLLGRGHQHPGREMVRQVPRSYLLNVTPR